MSEEVNRDDQKKRRSRPVGVRTAIALTLFFVGGWPCVEARGEGSLAPALEAFTENYCLDCHDDVVAEGGLDLLPILDGSFENQREAWEKVLKRLETRQMPPAKTKRRPSEEAYARAVEGLAEELDALAARHPDPGRTETLRRLNRAEYENAVRDLLAVEIDASTLLPADELSHGFDNVTVGNLPATLLERYISAAQKISRLAVGTPPRVPVGETFRVRPDLTQESRIEGLPFGTRGGARITHHFPREGEYEITIRLTRDRNDLVEGLGVRNGNSAVAGAGRGHEILVLLDGEEVKRFTVIPPKGRGHQAVDAHLKARLSIPAGLHEVGVTFLQGSRSLLAYKRQPYESHFNFHRHPRLGPALYQVGILGPLDRGQAGETASRERIFGEIEPAASDHDDREAAEGESHAREILTRLLRQAWRRPVDSGEVERLMPFYEEGFEEGGFENGIESALAAILVSREFLFRVEEEPPNVDPGQPYEVDDVSLASRLSFFLWSSLPDERLLRLAETGQLSEPGVLEAETLRLLADSRSQALVDNFASQWLHLRNLESITPDGRLYPDFDDNLRQAMRRETELCFEKILREDLPVTQLLRSDHTFLNERLAKHYGIPHVYGPHFRRVDLAADSRRGGLLRHASVLTVTSYATRTSPVIRGTWILENLLGTPPPPPEPDVPALDDNTVSANLPIRERLAAHRDNPACISCHEFIDPPGFALENYDAIGQWRDREAGLPVDATGGLPDGSEFVGVEGLEEGLLRRPESFAATVAEKLLIYALGRGVESSDGPAIRGIVRRAAAEDYRFSALVLGVVESVPFRMRRAAEPSVDPAAASVR